MDALVLDAFARADVADADGSDSAAEGARPSDSSRELLDPPAQPPEPQVSEEQKALDADVLSASRRHNMVRRNRLRQQARISSRMVVYKIRMKLVAKYSKPKKITVRLVAERLPHSRGGWVGLRDHGIPLVTKVTLARLSRLGFRYYAWNGRVHHAIVDHKGRIIGSLAGRPVGDDTWDDDCVSAYDDLNDGLQQLKLTPDQTYHRRGNYPALSMGISYGGGQTEPAQLLLNENNKPIAKKLRAGRGVRRISGFMN
ncbi:hypothetical protein FA95DRAFT_1578318, partial [Auriscalpium vulgare]